MPIAISKATPSYKNHWALTLCQINQLPYITTYPEDHLIWFTWHTHAIRAFLGTKLFDQTPCTQLSSNFTHIVYTPILAYYEFWGFFWDEEDLCHFIEHLLDRRFT